MWDKMKDKVFVACYGCVMGGSHLWHSIERGVKAVCQAISGSVVAQVALVAVGVLLLDTNWVSLGIAVSWAVYAILGNSAMWAVTRMLDSIWGSDTAEHMSGWAVGQPLAYAIYRGLILIAFGVVNAAALLAAAGGI